MFQLTRRYIPSIVLNTSTIVPHTLLEELQRQKEKERWIYYYNR